jgi:tRNA A37 threonylcarbamoyladenosine biosynthesis protein TsaE
LLWDQEAKRALELGFKKIISDPNNIIAIEWAGNVKRILPKDTLWIFFKIIDKNKRQIKIVP